MDTNLFWEKLVKVLESQQVEQELSIKVINREQGNIVNVVLNNGDSYKICILKSEAKTHEEDAVIIDSIVCTDVRILENGLNVPIEYVYRNEKKLNTFMKNCSRKEKYFMKDLDEKDFEELVGINDVVAAELKKIYLDFYELCRRIDNLPVEEKKRLLDKCKQGKTICLNDELKELNIDQLLNLNLSKSLIKSFKNNGINTFLDLKEREYLLADIESNTRDIIIKALSLSLKEYIKLVLAYKKNDDYYNVMIQRAEGKTLQEIGNLEHVERETIRSREKKFSIKIIELIDLFLDKYENDKNGVIQREDINEVFAADDNTANVILRCLHYSRKYEYLNFCEKFVLKERVGDEKKLKQRLQEIANTFIADGTNFVDAQDSIRESLINNEIDYIDMQDFLEFLIQQGYHKYGDYIAKKGTSYGLVVADAIKKYYPEGFLTQNEKEQEKLFEILDKEYVGLSYSKGCRAFGVCIEKALVLCDRGKYMHSDHIVVEQNLIGEIYDYINSSSQSSFYDQELFGKFETELSKRSNIKNRYMLHGVLHEYYPEDFRYDRDIITKVGKKKTRIEERIAVYLKEKQCPVSIKKVAEDMGGIKESLVFQASLRNKQILMWGTDYIQYIENLVLTEDVKEDIYNILNTICDKYNGYCSEELLFEKISETIPKFIERNHVNKRGMFFIARALFSSIYNFEHLPHIVKRDTKIKEVNFKEIFYMIMGIGNVFDYNEIKDKAREVGWSDPTIYMLLRDVRNDWIQISMYRYIKPSEFFITEKNIQKIAYVINKVIRDQGYISLYYQKDFYSELPDIGFEWNGFLINSIIEHYKMNFRVICPQNQSRDSAKIFILDSKTTIETYDELIASEMKKNHINSISEEKWRDYLHDKKLIVQIIPQELYCSDRFTIKDEVVSLV